MNTTNITIIIITNINTVTTIIATITIITITPSIKNDLEKVKNGKMSFYVIKTTMYHSPTWPWPQKYLHLNCNSFLAQFGTRFVPQKFIKPQPN